MTYYAALLLLSIGNYHWDGCIYELRRKRFPFVAQQSVYKFLPLFITCQALPLEGDIHNPLNIAINFAMVFTRETDQLLSPSSFKMCLSHFEDKAVSLDNHFLLSQSCCASLFSILSLLASQDVLFYRRW